MLLKRREFLAVSCAAIAGACGTSLDSMQSSAVVWGREGYRDGSFLRPRAIGCHEGEVYVIDTTGRVQVFTANGEFARLWKTPDASNGTPTAISFDSDGRVLIPDTHYHQILVYSTEGELLDKYGEYGTEPGKFIYPTGIAEGPDDLFYVAEYGEGAMRIQVFDREWNHVRQWGRMGDEPGALNRPMAIAATRAGALYVADMANHRVQVFDADGELQHVITSGPDTEYELKFPFDVAIGPDASAFTADYGTHQVCRFTADGNFVRGMGRAGRRPGEFNGPRGIDISPEDYVYVADTGNHRIQRFPAEAWS